MTEQDLMAQARQYVIENFMYMRKNQELGDDDSLLRTGIISSLGMMELVGWVEDTFGLAVDPAEITEQNFDSLRNLARFVSSKANLTVA